MSAKAETLDPGRHIAPLVLAIVLALTIGVAAGALITGAATSDTTVAAEQTTRGVVAGIQAWDQQKLDAMEGRQAAETFRSSVADQAPISIGIPGWDQGMVDAMANYQSFYGA